MVQRSSGPFVEARVLEVYPNGNVKVGWTTADGQWATKVVPRASLRDSFDVGNLVTVARSDGSRSTAEVIARSNDGRAEVVFRTADGQRATKVVRMEELNAAPFRNGDQVSIPRSDGSRSTGTIAATSDGNALVVFRTADGVEASKTVPLGQVRPVAQADGATAPGAQAARVAVQPVPTRSVASLFQNQRGLTVAADAEYVSGRRFISASGQEYRFSVRSSPEFRDAALAQGRIREFAPGARAQLNPGTYTYVVTRDGRTAFGQLDDTFELGTKHQNIANGREVVSAGEVRVNPDGSFNYNLESGTFTRTLEEQGVVTRSDLRARTDQTLNTVFGRNGRYTESVLAPQRQPSLDTIRNACGNRAFWAYNIDACCRSVNICR